MLAHPMTMARSFSVLTLCLVGLALAGCKSSGQNRDGSGGGTAASSHVSGDNAGCKKYKACDLLTPADISKATGANVVKAGSDLDVSSAPDVAVSCRYMDPLVVTLVVSCVANGGNGPTRYAEHKPKGDKSLHVEEPVVTSISGLGNGAGWWAVYPPPPPMKESQYHIMVFWGAGGKLTINFYMPRGSKVDPLTAGKQMAQAVLAKL
jgi:hypothetical protein